MADQLIEISKLDLNKTVMGRAQIDEYLPQRHEFQQLDRIIHCDTENEIIAAVQEITLDKFWVRGHFPGNATMPGVMMCETAAQLSSIANKIICGIAKDKLMGFAGMEKVRFRGLVVPGVSLLMVAKAIRADPRLAKFQCQGFVENKLVFEAILLGMPIPVAKSST